MRMKKIAVLCSAVLLACLLLSVPASAAGENAAGGDDAAHSIDLDLSPFTGTVVYAQIYQMAL